MKDSPCNVCGNTDLNLVDGFYYCVECGTQDANVRETVIGESFLAEGTKMFATGKKFSIVVKKGIQMSAEWYKWHAYNFILCGLVEELIKLGAKQSVKTKVFWIWTRYMKKFQEKEEDEKENLQTQSKEEKTPEPVKKRKRSKSSESLDGTTDPESDDEEDNTPAKYIKNIRIITKGLLLAIIYLGLNFDKSPIQLSHLFRYIKEGRLSLFKCTKFVPKEIETQLIPCWKNFCLCQCDYKFNTILHYAMTCTKVLDLGLPVLPDFNIMIHNYIKELCLPNNFKNLVFSLMLYKPYYVKVNNITMKKMARIPDYETSAMSYILVALKMCFGLDGHYDVKISNVVNKINNDENPMKSYKIGTYTEPTDRLFSFDDWTRFLQFRKIILCRYYLPMAGQYNIEGDDYLLMEHLDERRKRHVRLSDEVTMDILNKIPQEKNINVIPKNEFLPSLTPLSTYTDVILNVVPNDEIRLLLSEDFTQYNLKYATNDIKLLDTEKNLNIITGINESNLKIEPNLDRNIDVVRSDCSMVFVRNCENKNWLKTKPPALEHIKQIDDKTLEESDHGDEAGMGDVDVKAEGDGDVKLVYFEEEREGINIFDDDFDSLVNDEKIDIEDKQNYEMEENFNTGQLTYDESEIDIDNKINFNENNFNKNEIIEELISLALKKYKVKMPTEYVPRPKKRKTDNTEPHERVPKHPRRKTGEVKKNINDMIGSYYNHIETDILTKVTERVKEAIERREHDQEVNVREDVTTNGDIVDYNDEIISDQINNSVEDLNNQRSDVNLTKNDPDFDSKTHDIGQLYVKLNDSIVEETISISDDPVIDEIILNKIEKLSSKKNTDVDEIPIVRRHKVSLSKDSSDVAKQGKSKEFFPPLITDPAQIDVFNYWLRCYNTDCIARYSQAYYKFDSELKDQFPPSFYFALNECANILCCSTYKLYKDMQVLEKMIVGKLKNSRR